MRKIFVTGTDTGVGKTYMSCRLLEHYNKQGLQTIGLKPVASGANPVNSQSEDAEQLQKAASIKLSYNQVNPYCFKLATAPSIAAAAENSTIRVENLVRYIEQISQIHHDIMIIEGVGGVYVPFNDTQTQLDLIKALDCPVIIVVEIKLGCINHALLSIESLKTRGIPIQGWMPNYINPMPTAKDYTKTLERWLGVQRLSIE